ncbi:MAG: ankyrin repeat domain-containing protein [Pseudomonadota bacterium]
MAKRRLPERPNTNYLRFEARRLLRGAMSGVPEAQADFERFHPNPPKTPRLSDAQVTLARSYSFPTWQRLTIAANLCRAIEDENLAAIEDMVRQHPSVLDEGLRGLDTSATWGVPLMYAVRHGKPRAVATLIHLSGRSEDHALERARSLGLSQMSEWFIDADGQAASASVMHPCETLNADNLNLLLDHGASVSDEQGDVLAPVAMVLKTYARSPGDKHRILEILERHGATIPDTPMMAFHRGSIDLLEKHITKDPALVHRRWTTDEIYPREMGCHEEGLHATPVAGTSFLHLCAEYGEVDLAVWLLSQGADPDLPATLSSGFGGHTPLYNCVVTLARRQSRDIATLLIENGATINRTTSLRKQLRFHRDEAMHEYRGVTPIEWGLQFHDQEMVAHDTVAYLRQALREEVRRR